MRVAIVGGGAIGSAAAYHIRRLIPDAKVTVIERDPTYAKASSALSASSIRQQFSDPVNIKLSMEALQFLRQPEVQSKVQFIEEGYLYLATSDAGKQVLDENSQLQRSLGADIQFLPSAKDIATRFPWITTSDIVAGTFGVTGEGRFDGFSLLQLLKSMAVAQGANYVQGEATEFVTSANAVKSVVVQHQKKGESSTTTSNISCDFVINAGGPWARRVAQFLNIDLPVYARRRVVHIFECDKTISGCPLVIDPTGMYFRGDGAQHATNRFLVGFAPEESNDPSDMPLEINNDDQEYFLNTLWPQLAARVPQFENISHKCSWAGYYEVHPMDHNAIVGPHPTLFPNFLMANGFSGHGLQHSYPIGRALAEWISTNGTYTSIDVSGLGYPRVMQKKPMVERNII